MVSTIKERLKAESGGQRSYDTSAASGLLFDRLRETNTLDEAGGEVMRLGCRVAIVEYGGGVSLKGVRARPEELGYRLSQTTFDQYDNGWLDDEVALNEGLRAVRKCRGDCKLAETKAWLALKEKKADEIWTDVKRGRLVLDQHPEWEDTPEATLAEILGLSE